MSDMMRQIDPHKHEFTSVGLCVKCGAMSEEACDKYLAGFSGIPAQTCEGCAHGFVAPSRPSLSHACVNCTRNPEAKLTDNYRKKA